MNLVLYTILKLLSRPVVCTNFQGLETNTCFSTSALYQGHSTLVITELNLWKLKSRNLSGPFTVQLNTRVLTRGSSTAVLTSFEIKIKVGFLLAKFCEAGCASTIGIFKLLQTRTAFRRFRGRKNFSTVDPESYRTIIILEVLGYLPVPSPRFTPRFLLFGRWGGVTLARFSYFSGTCKYPSTQIQICPNKAEVSKRQYSSKAKSFNVHYFLISRGKVLGAW
jgi:hypothetical protein